MKVDHYARYRELLADAARAVHARGHWTAYDEAPRAYGENAKEEGRLAFEAHLGQEFPIDQPGQDGWTGGERSPYGIRLEVRYPHANVDKLLAAAREALPGWRDAGPDVRAGVCAEILHELNRHSHEIAHATMHTTGQPYLMAFQAGGPHAQERGLEAVACGHQAMTASVSTARWEKPSRDGGLTRVDKRFTVVPRGVGLVVGCNTFPTWNGYPGMFASLVAGNPVVVKPHPRAVLPLAITVRIARAVLADAGLPPDVVTLAAEVPGERSASVLATRPEVRIVDFTGGAEFGTWLERNAHQALVHTEKSGVNNVVIDSTGAYRGMLRNLAVSLSLYSGQMCTTPQNVLVPRAGIATDEGHKDLDAVIADLAGALAKLHADPARSVEVLGAIVGDEVLARIEAAQELGEVIVASRAVRHPRYPEATVRTPALVRLDPGRDDVYGREHFGPVAFVVPTADTTHGLALLRRTVSESGGLSAAVYSRDDDVLAAAERAALDAGVNLSCNLTGDVLVNQSAAFSDFHGTGANPAATASLTDPAFVAGRFHLVQSRRAVGGDA